MSEIPHWCDPDYIVQHQCGEFDWPAHDEACKTTWCEEAVQVTDDSTKCGPERGLIVHTAGNEICQFNPLWSRKLLTILIEKSFL